MNKHNYHKCTFCNKQQKKSTLIKINTANQTGIINIDNIKIICEICFDKSKFIELLNDELILLTNNDVNDVNNPQIFMSSKQLFVDKKEWKKYSKSKNLSNQKTERKQILITQLSAYKISYEKYSKNQNCEMYINFGNPNLDTVIQRLYFKQSEEDNRLCELLEKLKSLNLEYDCKIPSYKKFITKGGNIDYIIESAEIEKDLIFNTNYLSICDITDSDTAKEIAIGEIEKKTKTLEKYITKKNTLRFD